MLGSARCHARDHNRAKRSASHRLAQLLLSPPASGLTVDSKRGYKEDLELHFINGVRDSFLNIDDSNLLNQFIKKKTLID